MTEKDSLSAIESHIVMTKPGYELFNNKVPHALSHLLESIAQQRQVNLLYKGVKDEAPKARTIEPAGLFHEMNFWYVYAYCHTRKDYRQFRADRISQLQLLDTPFEREHPPLDEFMAKRERAHSDLPKITARIRVENRHAAYMKWDRRFWGFISEHDRGTHTDMVFETADFQEGFPRWLLIYGDGVQILEPDSLRIRMLELIEEVAANLKR